MRRKALAERAALEQAKICPTEAKRTSCDCIKCRWRRGDFGYDPPSKEPTDPAGSAARLLTGVRDPVEREILMYVVHGEKPPTRANVLQQVTELHSLGAETNPQAAASALDALLAAGFIDEEDGELRPTILVELARRPSVD
jgi:hypothetical protein